MVFFWMIVILIMVSACKAESKRACGCLIYPSEYGSANTAGCSHQTSIDFRCLSELELNILILQNNTYGSPPNELLQHDFSNVTHIDLSYNEITEVPDDWVTHFPRLSILNLDHNRLAHAPALLLDYENIKILVHYNPFICDCAHVDELLNIANVHKYYIQFYLNY